ncbi:WD40-like Beta Propeller Repeat [Halopenitus malekzadehii]|uniref:WD40-like Beta Propeller Repeat n=1 Tax=Halopenitus malekzadehii TaxID=1267564 RepID=A0A1H6I4Y5_9EURY|nr:amidohydrolase family protein [Halopenitus malekzadehii]SEH41844.1 WD40-like Beta Propeller Repeat [Halopenitus malekzadehii]
MPDKKASHRQYRLTRRRQLGLLGTALGASVAGCGSTSTPAEQPTRNSPTDTENPSETPNTNEHGNQVTVTSGTNIAVTGSPDGETLILDHAGILFRLPGDGGEAERITDLELEPAYPAYGPDGERVAFQGYADGVYDIYTMAPDGSNIEQLTDNPHWDAREPAWSADGSTIAFASDQGMGYDIWLLDVATGEVSQLTDTDAENYLPTWSPDGSEIAYITETGNTIKAVSIEENTSRTLYTAGEGERFRALSWGPNGDLAYVQVAGSEADLLVDGEQVTANEDVFPLPPHWQSANELLYTADGKIKTRDVTAESGDATDIPFTTTFDLPTLDYERKSYEFDQRNEQAVTGIQTPALSPDGDRVAFIALNDLWTMEIGEQPTRVTEDQYYQTAPAWHPDGRFLAYSSDKAGTEDVYAYDTETDSHHRITSLKDEAAIKATWAPDGSELAFQNQNGATFTIGVNVDNDTVEADGEPRTVLGAQFAPGAPTWSANGQTLAMTVNVPFTERFTPSGRLFGTNQILTVDVDSGETDIHPPGEEFASVATRNNDGPVWSPDGQYMAFVVESTLRVMPVDENGDPTGQTREITNEVTDGPSWSGDSEWLLYLNNGQLKKVRYDGTETQDIPLQLTYQRQHPDGRTVVYVGGMWDGKDAELKEDVTIEIAGNRIERVETDTEPPNGQYVDASELTVIPGLWDGHNHQTYSEELFGARQGLVNLAYGVTTTVDRAAFAYHAVHDREANAANERIAPRYFMTGELLDGSRTMFPTNRMVRSSDQLELELSRARELEYDSLKTYERLNATLTDDVVEFAHDELGVPAGSHYVVPGLQLGQNGTTHMDEFSRFGFSRAESATNQSYEDYVQFHTTGDRRWTITTFFDNSFILSEDLEDDPRLELFPPWRRQGLLAATANNEEYPDDPDCTSGLCRNVGGAKRIIDNGGLVVAGTDVPLTYNGVELHANLRPMVEYGLSEHEALLTATRFAAEHQGVDDDLGTIEAGKLADMVFVDGDPLEDISTAMNVQMTMTDGDLYTIDDLLDLFVSNDS